jgi:putative hemolysin
VHPVAFVPMSMPAPSLLRDLQRRRTPLAVVVDEQGTVRGMVTIEDLVEELVGEILSEGEVESSKIRHQDDGTIWVEGSTPIHEVNRELGVELPEGEWAATIGGLAIELAGRIPGEGDEIPVDGWILEVVEASHRQVKVVRLRPSGGEAEMPAPSP